MTFDSPSPGVIRSSDGFTVTVIGAGLSPIVEYQCGDFVVRLLGEWGVGQERILHLYRTSAARFDQIPFDDPRIEQVLEDIHRAFESRGIRVGALDPKRVYPIPFPDL